MPYTDRIAIRGLTVVLATVPFAFMFATAWGADPVSGRVAVQQAVLLTLCGLSGAAVLRLAAGGHRAARAALAHPAVLLPLATAALGFVLAPFHPFPWRTVEGLPDSPHHHFGALWFVETAMLAAGYLTAARGSLRTPLAACLAVAAVAAAAVTAATLNFEGEPLLARIMPSWYNFVSLHVLPSGYRAWIAPVGLMAAAVLYGTGTRSGRLAAVALLAFMLWAGNNSTAAIAAAVGLVFAGAARILPRLGSIGSRAALCLVLVAAPAAIVPFAAAPIEKADVKGVNAAIASLSDGIPSLDPRDHVVMNLMPGRTIWSRAWMQRIVAEDLLSRPLLLAVGRGWGTFAESYAAHWREVPGRRFRDRLGPTSPMSKTHWDAHTSARFHPHNTFLDAAASLGAFGAALLAILLALPALLPRKSNRSAAIALGLSLCTVAGFWFLESSFAPFLAAAFAATVRPLRFGPAGLKLPRAAFPVAVLLCVAGAALSLVHAKPGPAPGCDEDRLGAPASLPAYAELLGTAIDKDRGWLLERIPMARALACNVRHLARPGGGLDALSEMLRLREILLTEFDDLPTERLFFEEIAAWKGDVERLLKAAPGRTDAVIGYVAWTARHRDADTAREAVAAFRPGISSEKDPVGPWLDACTALLSGDRPGHRRLVEAALEGGLANFTPASLLPACEKFPSPERGP